MDHPERPSRHKNHDKWKRIIEPAGDSDSSEWSSDSDVGLGGIAHHYRHHDSSSGGGSSSNGNRDQQSSVNGSMSSSSSQNKQLRDSLLNYRSVEGDSFKFEPALGVKASSSVQNVPGVWAADLRALSARLKSIGSDTGAGTSSSSFTHLMHHDYAEKEVNNDRGSGDFPFSHSPSRDSLVAWKRKRKWMLCNKPEVPITAIDCSIGSSAPPSTSSYGLTADETAVHETDNGNNMETNITETPEEEDRWRIHSSNRNVVNSPTRKRCFDSLLNSTEQSDVGDGFLVSGCSTSVVLSTSMQNQTQSGQNDCGMLSGGTESGSQPVPPCSFFSPFDVYVQKKVMSRNKQVRFRDPPCVHEYGESSSVPEDYSHSIPRPEEVPEIQVLSMAGPSNSSSRIVYPNSPRHSRSLSEEASTSDEAQAIPPAVSSVVEAEDEGVEVIMVDDTQPENSVDNKSTQATAVSAQDQQEQQQQQQSSVQQQQTKDDENVGPTSMKLMRLDDELLNQGLIGLLECPVCMEYMGPPIHQCRRGHLVCSICKPKLPSCPTCRSRFTESRNLAMEKVADKLHYPCKNAHVGCTTTLRLRDKDEHEANCIFRSYRCIVVPPCEWKGQHGDILPHVRQMHANTLLQGPEHMLEMHLGDFTEQSSQNWIVSALGELFRVNLGAVRGGRVQVFGSVLLLGPARRAPLFRYTLTVGPVEGDKAQRQMTYTRTTHCYVERCSVYYSAGDSFHLRTESAQLFSSGPQNDRVMCVKLRLEKTES